MFEDDLPWDEEDTYDPHEYVEYADGKRGRSSFRSAYEDEDFAALKGSEKNVHLPDLIPQAWQRLYQHFVCSLGSSTAPSTFLLTEAELHLQSHEYRQALVCALATENLSGCKNCDDCGSCVRRGMIKTIALYQEGDKNQAEECKASVWKSLGVDELSEEATVEDFSIDDLSKFLFERFKGTCQVLTLMPELLNMLAGMGR